jgi:hypothetical protein
MWKHDDNFARHSGSAHCIFMWSLVLAVNMTYAQLRKCSEASHWCVGHASWSFASMFFISMYLYHFLRPTGYPDSAWALLAVVLPSVFAAWVAASRVIDYYHNPSDVVAGALLGILVVFLAFRVYFSKQLKSGGIPEQQSLRRQTFSASVDMGSLARHHGIRPASPAPSVQMLNV